jgi:hypothetical protein
MMMLAPMQLNTLLYRHLIGVGKKEEQAKQTDRSPKQPFCGSPSTHIESALFPFGRY